jgi:hypothetical protein
VRLGEGLDRRLRLRLLVPVVLLLLVLLRLLLLVLVLVLLLLLLVLLLVLVLLVLLLLLLLLLRALLIVNIINHENFRRGHSLAPGRVGGWAGGPGCERSRSGAHLQKRVAGGVVVVVAPGEHRLDLQNHILRTREKTKSKRKGKFTNEITPVLTTWPRWGNSWYSSASIASWLVSTDPEPEAHEAPAPEAEY